MRNYNLVKRDAINVVCGNFEAFIDELIEDGKLSEIEKYIPDSKYRDRYSWNMEKTKIVFELLKLRAPEAEERMLSYLECSEYGWQGGDYCLSNPCSGISGHCKRNYKVENTPEATTDAFENVELVFRHKEYGSISSYLFGYCLAALFSSRLKREYLRVPYFLQIACDRNSNMYRLIHEIVDICDINTALAEHCDFRYDYKHCNYDHVTIFPTQPVEKTEGDLMCNRDIPVVIDGYENEKLYGALLRDVANIPGRRRKLDSRDKFSVLPIFVCPAIRSQFRNVFSMDLTDLDVDEDYLELIKKNKQMLASWALELIISADKYFSLENTEQNRRLHASPFLSGLSFYTNKIREKYRHYTELSQNDVNNISFLAYFLYRYMEVFRDSITLNYEIEFEYGGKTAKYNPAKLIAGIMERVIKSLFDLHNEYSPTLPMTVNIDTGSSGGEESKWAKRIGEMYAKNIVKYYQSYGVSIRISDAEFKDNRYIFSVKLMPGTDRKLINRYADEVRRLLGLEFFSLSVDNSLIKIVASEKPLKENSLIKILESPEFMESRMEIPYAVGYDIMGEMVIADIAKFPHLLIGGASGSGKSSALHSLIMSIVYRQRPGKVKLLLLDFGGSRLKMFDQTPHMVMPVVTEIEKGRQCIIKLREIMEQRLKELDFIDERNWDRELGKWHSIICVIDEFPTFIRGLTAEKSNRMSYMIIADLLERARKVKIHLILATQDSSKGNILIKKTNIGAAIALSCTNKYDSQVIIGVSDAASLSDAGSMYFKCYQHEGIKRVQGSYMDPVEIMDMLDDMEFEHSDMEEQYNEIYFEIKQLPKLNGTEAESDDFIPEDTPEKKLAQIIMLALERGNISNIQIKKEYGMGFDKANVFLKELETLGLITKLRTGTRLSRSVIPKSMEDVPDKVMKYLEEYGYTETDISEAMRKRLDITDTQ